MSNVLLAFGVTVGAGLATIVGALVPFCLRKAKSGTVLALSLSFAAGVMLFVSLVSIFGKSLESWRRVEAVGQRFAMLTATACFLLGVGVTAAIDACVHRIDRHGAHSHAVGGADDALATLLEEIKEDGEHAAAGSAGSAPSTRQRAALRRMGLLLAAAMVIHNIPEGIATYAGTLADTRVGVGLAVAIAIHNIPAGVCIAMPIYFATRSCWKGVALAAAVGACEPLGALLAYLFLASTDTAISFGIVFAFVSGMLTHVAIHESLPTAKRFDDRLATLGFTSGMTIIALSLALFDATSQ